MSSLQCISPVGWQRILVRIDLSVKAGHAAIRDAYEPRIQTTIQRKVELGKIAEALDPIDTTTALPKEEIVDVVTPSQFPPGDPKLNDFDINEPYEVLPEIDHDILQKAMARLPQPKGALGSRSNFGIPCSRINQTLSSSW